jgi:hypothetical protein
MIRRFVAVLAVALFAAGALSGPARAGDSGVTHDMRGCAVTHDMRGSGVTHDMRGCAVTHDMRGCAVTHDM